VRFVSGIMLCKFLRPAEVPGANRPQLPVRGACGGTMLTEEGCGDSGATASGACFGIGFRLSYYKTISILWHNLLVTCEWRADQGLFTFGSVPKPEAKKLAKIYVYAEFRGYAWRKWDYSSAGYTSL